MKASLSKSLESGVFGLFKRTATSLLIALVLLTSLSLSGCTRVPRGDPALAKNVYLELVDWHIVGLWVINSPCCWIRVVNYNDVPVKNVTIRYRTFGYGGEPLTVGTYKMDGTVQAGSAKNFIEQYIGNVDLESDMLSVELVSVSKSQESH